MIVGTIVAAAVWAVIASLVFSAVLGAAVFAVIQFARPAAATRQALWSVASGAAGFAPVVILAAMILRGAHGSAADGMTAHPVPAAILHAAGATIGSTNGTPVEPMAAAPAAAIRLGVPAPPDLAPLAAQIIVGVWLLVALGGLLGLGRSLMRVRGLKLRSSPLDGDLATDLPWLTTTAGREIYLRLSYETETPIAVGFRRPVILIPTDMATAAGLISIEPLVMHEYAHLARYDDWTNLAQRAIERIFWFNPLVWILGRRIALEREVAADEAVVARTHDAKTYASTLWRMAQEMRMPEHVVVAPGAMLTRKQISVRIERLLEDAPLGRRFGAAGFAVAAVALSGVAALAASAPAVSLVQDDAMPIAAASSAPVAERHERSEHHDRSHSTAQAEPKRIVVAQVMNGPESSATLPPLPAATIEPPAPVAPVAPVTPVAQGVAPVAAVSGIDAATLQRLKDLGPQISSEVQRSVAQAASSTSRDANDTGDDDPRMRAPISRSMIASCSGCDFSHHDLRGLDLSGVDLTGDDFSHALLDGANFSNATLKGIDFTRARLTGAKFRSANLTGVDFSHSNLRNVDFTNALLTGVDLSGADMGGAITDGIHLIGSSLP